MTHNTDSLDETGNKILVTIPFWSENPNVLLDIKYALELFPVDSMTYTQKLNALTRLIILMTVVSFAVSRSIRLLVIGGITIGCIYLLYYYHEKENKKLNVRPANQVLEGFDNSSPAYSYMVQNNIPIPDNVFDKPSEGNPLSNVLLTDYDFNPNKKPAPPLFNADVNAQLLTQAKQLVVDQNPDQPDIADKLFHDLGENLVFEQSMRQFYSNPSTTIPNDQAGFAEFCYGSMISCKEGNKFACARNLSRYTNT